MSDNREWPKGQISDDDDGEVAVLIGIENDRVVVRFATDVSWVGFDVDDAIAFAGSLVKRAAQLNRERYEASER